MIEQTDMEVEIVLKIVTLEENRLLGELPVVECTARQRRVPSHFWAQFDPQNGAHCQAIIVFILTQSVGPTHLSITH